MTKERHAAPAPGVMSVRSDANSARVQATIDALLDAVGDDENHPLAEVLDVLSDQIKAYEDENVHIPRAEPKEVLRFLMEQHDLNQEDLTDCAPQSQISNFLTGNRTPSKAVAKLLAQRFHVRADLFFQWPA